MTTSLKSEGHPICECLPYLFISLDFSDFGLPVICDDCKKLLLLLLPANNHPTVPWTLIIKPLPSPPSRALLRAQYHPVLAQKARLRSWSPRSLNDHLFLLFPSHHHGIQLLRTHTTITTPNKTARHLRLTTVQGPLNLVKTSCFHIPRLSLTMRNSRILFRPIPSAHIHIITGHTSSTNCCQFQFHFLPQSPLSPITVDLAGWKKSRLETLYS